uniref:Uncharacterized protein n=1 Tax=Tetranychus urticae TaxID=32264 RepID=T1K3T7_TETUR
MEKCFNLENTNCVVSYIRFAVDSTMNTIILILKCVLLAIFAASEWSWTRIARSSDILRNFSDIPAEKPTFFHPSESSPHQSSSLIQGTLGTCSTKPSSSGSSAGGSIMPQGIPMSCPYPDTSCYPESEKPMIGPGSAQLLSSGRKSTGVSGSGYEEMSRLYDHSMDTDLEMETRALMEGLSHSDATTGPMRPIIMKSDVSLTRIPLQTPWGRESYQ